MTKLKVAAWSDGHGTLPTLSSPADIMIIAGDISPLNIQRNKFEMFHWFTTEFVDYVNNAPVDKVILVAGNHDFFLEMQTNKDIENLTKATNNKLVYLFDNMYTYKGVSFYGCPWCVGPANWPFSPSGNYYSPDLEPIHKLYKRIPDCDVLITHQPPMIDGLGVSNFGNGETREFGSIILTRVIEDHKIKYHFCGHIHTGTHYGVSYNDTILYNVSLKNEQYNDVFDVTYMEIKK